MDNNKNMPASPIFNADGDISQTPFGDKYKGMTKREAFAMAAMQGYCTSVVAEDMSDEILVKFSVSAADALLKELSK